jgi:hypothetical protein
MTKNNKWPSPGYYAERFAWHVRQQLKNCDVPGPVIQNILWEHEEEVKKARMRGYNSGRKYRAKNPLPADELPPIDLTGRWGKPTAI